jgi:phage recombination protein Bet
MTDVDRNATALVPVATPRKLLERMADRVGVDPELFRAALEKTVMPKDFSKEEFLGCMLVADQYQLDPFTKQIYFMRTKSGAVQPIVSIDGWVHIVNRHEQFDGMKFESVLDDGGRETAVTCTIIRKDRNYPIEVTEYLDECRGDTPPWRKHPRRMLRHRALMQCARYAFGISGVMDADEFAQWQANEASAPPRKSSASAKRDGTAGLFNELRQEIANCINVEMLEHVMSAREGDIAALPTRWHELIQADYEALADTLRARMS